MKMQRWKLYLQDKDFHLCLVPGKEVHQFIPDTTTRQQKKASSLLGLY
jgi:hypothetical protein